MRKGCVEGGPALFAPTAIAARHQQAAVDEIKEAVRFGARFEMPRDSPPGIAAHRGGTIMVTADAERHSLGGAPAEFRVQQRVELIPVTGGERGVESACEIGSFAVFHPSIPFFSSSLLQTAVIT